MARIYRDPVRPKMLESAQRESLPYCCQTSAAVRKRMFANDESNERMLNTAEMRMLRWTCGFARRNRVRNNDLRTMLQTVPVRLKLLNKVMMGRSCNKKAITSYYPQSLRDGTFR
ncbi:hypothetical protein Y032_0045g1224 [Ancylostoma ceylanicum]|uniref:Uncharacterized protein n=1 Tax=Ancylostoma ceylanicum TaxID=53326 RepID=A0A016UDQ9_9BILA|nr:hypothetical protein Y032_0045g1224 [Ancylostoma ceylanicum]